MAGKHGRHGASDDLASRASLIRCAEGWLGCRQSVVAKDWIADSPAIFSVRPLGRKPPASVNALGQHLSPQGWARDPARQRTPQPAGLIIRRSQPRKSAQGHQPTAPPQLKRARRHPTAQQRVSDQLMRWKGWSVTHLDRHQPSPHPVPGLALMAQAPRPGHGQAIAVAWARPPSTGCMGTAVIKPE